MLALLYMADSETDAVLLLLHQTLSCRPTYEEVLLSMNKAKAILSIPSIVHACDASLHTFVNRWYKRTLNCHQRT